MTDERSTTGDDDTIARPFDQTNGMTDIGGETDGTARSDTESAAERSDGDGLDGTVAGDRLDGAEVGDDRERGADEEDLGFGGPAAAGGLQRG
ncbi:hypothetical protein QDR37_01720 [Amnibacterium sp. CER49]|uniref:hypothetical protein n=1 Tax=Amnibacterium sp. CER49 TaxID=3039161 RepID=UPI0024494E58|nr:hypothetical protein [Amnibacterium sp. CER49]MDH2442654.1 hypothetical protein [Amnibacterium sp. CER49]